MNYSEIVDYIYNIPKFTKKGGLSQTAQVMAQFGHPENTFRYIHIAGTNGKGSVSAYLSSMLMENGLRTGLFTSPHLVKINERMKINGTDISDGDFIRIFFAVKEKIDAWIQNGGVHPTFFEFVYLMAMLWFQENEVDIAVVETGLGGRLDATNVAAKPILTVITSIGYDHMQYLGNTLTEIAGEKAGIIKSGCPLVYDASSDKQAVQVFKERADKLKVMAVPTEKKELYFLKSDRERLCYQLKPMTYGDTSEKIQVTLLTPARYQAMNSALAFRGMEMLRLTSGLCDGVNDEVFYGRIKKALLKAKWPGRFERTAPNIYIDGAHNEAGICALCESIEFGFTDSGIHLLFAVAEDKDYTEMIRRLCNLKNLKSVTVTAIENDRRTPVETVTEIFRKNWHGFIRETYNIKEAFNEAVKGTGSRELLFCTGSLYLAGSLKALQKGLSND